jgi:MFS family permease
LTLFILKLTGTGVGVGLVAACQFGPMLFLSPWGGAVADRSDKRRMLFVTQGLEMAQSIGLAIVAFMPHPTLVGLYALALLGGVLLAFDNALRRSFVTEMVPPADLANAVVLYSTIVNLSRIFGPALAGLLVVTVGYGWCFTLDAASYIAVLVCLALMRPADLHRHPPTPTAKGAVRESLRYVCSVPELWISFAMLGVISMLAYNFNVTLPLFVTRALGGGEGTFTMLYAVLSSGSVVSALVIAHRNLVAMRDIVRGAAFFGASLLLMAAVRGVAAAIPVSFLVGAASIPFMTSTTAIVQVRGRRDMQGRVLALQMVFLGGSAAIGGPLLGWIADTVGARALMIIGGAACLGSAAFGAAMAAATSHVPPGPP